MIIHGFPTILQNCIKNLYSEQATTINGSQIKTTIWVQQTDPLSQHLFNLIVDEGLWSITAVDFENELKKIN